MLKNVCFHPKKHKKPLKIKDFCILVKFWLRQSDVMLHIVMLLPTVAVMWCVPFHVPKAHFTREVRITCEAYFTFRASGTLSWKKPSLSTWLFSCEETRKRCVSVGKNAKKVRNLIDNFTYPKHRIHYAALLCLTILLRFRNLMACFF